MKITKNMYLNVNKDGEFTIEARELFVYADNHSEIYEDYIMPAIDNLNKKVKKGTYDKEKAIEMFWYAADEAAKRYKEEFGYRFSVNDRWNCAIQLRNDYEENYKYLKEEE